LFDKGRRRRTLREFPHNSGIARDDVKKVLGHGRTPHRGGIAGGFRGRRVTTCSFCGKSSRDVGPMVEGPSDVYICANCVDLAHNIIRQEKRKLTASQPLFNTIPSPRQIKEFLDQFVIGQNYAKKALAVAVHNHYKRLSTGESAARAEGPPAPKPSQRPATKSRSTRATSC
jgi:hypothetical protein